MTAADWYVDPLGRYEGRYFDGENWTGQVKDRGRLTIDPDWDRAASEDDTEDIDPTEEYVVTTSTNATAERATDAVTVDPGFESSERAAVEPILPSLGAGVAEGDELTTHDMVDFTTESPARPVAVLEDVANASPEVPTDSIVAEEPKSGRRWLLALGAAVLAAAVLIALLPRLFGNDEAADSVDTVDPVEEVADAADDDADAGAGLPATDDEGDANTAAIEDADDGDAMADGADEADAMEDGAMEDGAMEDGAMEDGAMAEDADDAQDDGEVEADNAATDTAGDSLPDDAMMVGSLQILNGKPMLEDLSEWHGSTLEGRDVVLGDDAGCWFGTIGEAVVQNAHCGPVATTPGAEPRFDLVPLRFEDVDDAVIQVRPVTDAVVIDAVLPNGLELVGPDGPVDRTSFEGTVERGARGERDSGN